MCYLGSDEPFECWETLDTEGLTELALHSGVDLRRIVALKRGSCCCVEGM